MVHWHRQTHSIERVRHAMVEMKGRTAMVHPSKFGATPNDLSTEAAIAELHRLGLPLIQGGEPTEEEKKAAADKAIADKAIADAEADRKKAEDAELDKLGEPGKKALIAEREARKKSEEDAKAAATRADDAEKRAKAAQDALDKIERDKAKAKDEALKTAGEFEKLAAERETQLSELQTRLEAINAENETLKKRVAAIDGRDEKRFTEGVKALPDDLKDLVPSLSMALGDRLDWLDKAAATVAKRTTDPSRRHNGNGRGPKERDGVPPEQDAARKMALERRYQ